LKSSSQHKQPSGKTELLLTAGHQPDVLGLFREILQQGTDLRVRVTGRSMRPFLRGGEVLTIRRTPSLFLRKGDLILFRNSHEEPVLHRILSRRKKEDGTFCFTTKGDALLSFDEEIHEDSVLGRVLQIQRPAGSGRAAPVDMNSMFYRCLNFSVAVLGFFKTRTYSFLPGNRKRTKKEIEKLEKY
jgi:signal peptidase I